MQDEDAYQELEDDEEQTSYCHQCEAYRSELSKAAGKLRYLDDARIKNPDLLDFDDRRARILKRRDIILECSAAHNLRHLQLEPSPDYSVGDRNEKRYFAIIRENGSDWRVVLVVRDSRRVESFLKRLRRYLIKREIKNVSYRRRELGKVFPLQPRRVQDLFVQQARELEKDVQAWMTTPSSW